MAKSQKEKARGHIECVENPESRDLLNSFLRSRRASGKSWNTVLSDLVPLKRLANRFSDLPLDELEKENLEEWASELMDKGYKEATISRKKLAVKTFYKWLNDGEEPEKTGWMNTTSPRSNEMHPDQLLSPEEVKSMIEACDHPRDRALVSVLYESGCRVGEFLGLNIKNVEFDQYGAVVRLNPDEGALKTGTRRIRLIESTPYLQTWIENHPDKNDPEAPLWISLGPKNYGERFSHYGLRDRLDLLAERADISKNIYPHLFRHSRATQLAKEGYSEQDMKIIMGWTRNSDMASVYMHMSGADVEKKILEKHDLLDEEEKEEGGPLEPKTCPRCGEEGIEPTAKFCPSCSMALDKEAVIELQKEEEEVGGDFSRLAANRPELLDEMGEMMEMVKLFRENKELLEKFKKMAE